MPSLNNKKLIFLPNRGRYSILYGDWMAHNEPRDEVDNVTLGDEGGIICWVWGGNMICNAFSSIKGLVLAVNYDDTIRVNGILKHVCYVTPDDVNKIYIIT